MAVSEGQGSRQTRNVQAGAGRGGSLPLSLYSGLTVSLRQVGVGPLTPGASEKLT